MLQILHIYVHIHIGCRFSLYEAAAALYNENLQPRSKKIYVIQEINGI